MKQVPETKIKLTDVKELLNKGYNLLGELREEADAPVAKLQAGRVYAKSSIENFIW